MRLMMARGNVMVSAGRLLEKETSAKETTRTHPSEAGPESARLEFPSWQVAGRLPADA